MSWRPAAEKAMRSAECRPLADLALRPEAFEEWLRATLRDGKLSASPLEDFRRTLDERESWMAASSGPGLPWPGGGNFWMCPRGGRGPRQDNATS